MSDDEGAKPRVKAPASAVDNVYDVRDLRCNLCNSLLRMLYPKPSKQSHSLNFPTFFSFDEQCQVFLTMENVLEKLKLLKYEVRFRRYLDIAYGYLRIRTPTIEMADIFPFKRRTKWLF